jgi:hypothetical protein
MQLQSVLYFLLFAGLFFVIMRFGCGAHIMGHAHRHGGTRHDDDGSDENLRWVAPNMTKDGTVCLSHIFNLSQPSAPYATPSAQRREAFRFAAATKFHVLRSNADVS